MRHLKYFNKINESHTHENEVDIIIDAMRDFLDDDRKILFKSAIDDMNYQDYIDKSSRYKNFKPIINAGNVIRGHFVIVFHDVKDYTDFVSIVNQMQNFSKPDQKLDEEFKWPDEEDVEELFSKYGLVNLTFDYYRPQYEKEATEVTVEFDSTSYDGKLSKSVEDLFELVCNRFGFSSYNYSYGDYRVTFEV